jgi:hypothetical protein
MANIENSIDKKANEIVNRFMEKGAIVSKHDFDFVRDLFLEAKEELIQELKTNE